MNKLYEDCLKIQSHPIQVRHEDDKAQGLDYKLYNIPIFFSEQRRFEIQFEDQFEPEFETGLKVVQDKTFFLNCSFLKVLPIIKGVSSAPKKIMTNFNFCFI